MEIQLMLSPVNDGSTNHLQTYGSLVILGLRGKGQLFRTQPESQS